MERDEITALVMFLGFIVIPGIIVSILAWASICFISNILDSSISKTRRKWSWAGLGTITLLIIATWIYLS